MTLVILGLDGVDAALVEGFDIDSFRLERHGDLETYTYANEVPYTLEVWPTVATGLHARDHGVTGTDNSEWDNPVLEAGSKITAHMPHWVRSGLGRFAQDRLGADFDIPETDADSVFDDPGRAVHNWPGLVNSRELHDVWRMTNQGWSKEVFEREVFGKAAAQFGWVTEMLRHDVSLVGVHVHALDVLGHAYTDDEADLRRCYQRIGAFVDDLREQLSDEDDLLLLSDHGIGTTWIDGDDPPSHSDRAFVASTIPDELPRSVFDVRDWIEAHVRDVGTDRTELELPEDQLRDLGYIE